MRTSLIRPTNLTPWTTSRRRLRDEYFPDYVTPIRKTSGRDDPLPPQVLAEGVKVTIYDEYEYEDEEEEEDMVEPIDKEPENPAPKYMVDLYKKYSRDRYSHPMSNIVRSFENLYPGKK